jgi:uncharacterized protein
VPARPPFVLTSNPVEFRPSPINPEWIVEGAPIARAAVVARSIDGFATTFMWDCSPGKFRWVYNNDETLHVLSGNVILDEGLPTEKHVGTGDVVYFPAGSVANWHVTNHIVKVAFVRRSMPQALLQTVNMLRKAKHMLRRKSVDYGRAQSSATAEVSLSL